MKHIFLKINKTENPILKNPLLSKPIKNILKNSTSAEDIKKKFLKIHNIENSYFFKYRPLRNEKNIFIFLKMNETENLEKCIFKKSTTLKVYKKIF